MFQVHLINKVVEWEQKLKMEKERQDNLKGKPYETAATTSSKKERRVNILQRLGRTKKHQPANPAAYDPYGEAEFN